MKKPLLPGFLLALGFLQAAVAKPPNVLFIAIDDLRPELGCYGDTVALTPNIDALARKGMVFTRAYCQQAVCSPSRTSLLTGLRPDTTEVWDLKTHFRKHLPDVVTLPQQFKNNGYFCQGMGKIYHSSLDDPASWSVPSTNPKASHGAERKPDEGRGPAFEISDKPDSELFDGALADMAVKALGEMKEKQQPFFLAVGFIKPHLPFVAPRSYWDLYQPERIPLAPNPFPPKGAPPYAIVPLGELHTYGGVPKERDLPDAYARQLKHGYFACVSYVDAQVGRVLAELDRLGLRDDTIIILWGDHGWKLGEHAAWAKHTNVENDTRVPLILSTPGMSHPGTRTSGIVELVDVYPTLAEIAGLPVPARTEGKSFKPLLDAPDGGWKQAAFSQYPRNQKDERLMGYTMRTDRYRLTRWVRTSAPELAVAVELYDEMADPQENTNVADLPENRELVDRLNKQFAGGWQAALPPSH